MLTFSPDTKPTLAERERDALAVNLKQLLAAAKPCPAQLRGSLVENSHYPKTPRKVLLAAIQNIEAAIAEAEGVSSK